MSEETVNSACFIDGRLFINKKEVVEDIEYWMYRLRIISESLNIKTTKQQNVMKRFIQKLLLWWSYKKHKNNKKSIWKL